VLFNRVLVSSLLGPSCPNGFGFSLANKSFIHPACFVSCESSSKHHSSSQHNKADPRKHNKANSHKHKSSNQSAKVVKTPEIVIDLDAEDDTDAFIWRCDSGLKSVSSNKMVTSVKLIIC